MEYTDYSYLYPPRPDVKIPQGMLGTFQKKGYIAQVKKNGTCTVVFACKDKVIFKTRHGDADEHKMWQPKPAHIEFFKARSQKGWNVWCGELLHSKTPHIKDHLFIFDQLVHNGNYLVGSQLADRLELMKTTLGEGDLVKDRFMIHEHVSRARSFTQGFAKLFTQLAPEDEGLVLKLPTASLGLCSKETSNSNWQCKSRIPHKNYGF